ncbi:MAG: hypothetical protein IVW53_07265 [Chloroflexi bacterium]|nr:hypothetical protein [Chloroflexota bacterium]
MRPRTSAGILLYRLTTGSLEVLIGHPGGPFFARRDEGSWSIPKGEAEVGDGTSPSGPALEGEDEGGPSVDRLLAVARREFAEETGHAVPQGPVVALGSIVQKGGKVVHAWAVEGDLDAATARSNTFELVWPPGSGLVVVVPELDRVAWFEPAEARRRLKASQVPFVDRLAAILDGAAPESGSTAR